VSCKLSTQHGHAEATHLIEAIGGHRLHGRFLMAGCSDNMVCLNGRDAIHLHHRLTAVARNNYRRGLRERSTNKSEREQDNQNVTRGPKDHRKNMA
jgi:hypothetical protein